jgi:hypothetical protein
MKTTIIKSFCLLLITTVMLTSCAEMRNQGKSKGNKGNKRHQEHGRRN